MILIRFTLNEEKPEYLMNLLHIERINYALEHTYKDDQHIFVFKLSEEYRDLVEGLGYTWEYTRHFMAPATVTKRPQKKGIEE